MEKEKIIADYKDARNIRDEYILDEDEMYFVEYIYNLQNHYSTLLKQAREEGRKEAKEEIKQWLIDEDFEGLAEQI